ncbi:hypothetical protein O159_15840 [Leifsonia xyli subsp. cynodontis DSM 46306]|jgi:hypothetical protein|uniref:Uncharacterized protein n=1 Tax=Leifsonia xyli subsp. cynodontis DSM 46306 TaxID=1389489 RepID=U3PDK4_LEIXC|nr:hypothetical protein O159_15840 [Leifsonia xyli subsp. cynodontis DSM 46306]
MIHHSTRCTIVSAESVNARNGSALPLTFSAAIPIAAATTITCSTLKLTVEVASAAPFSTSTWVFTCAPAKFAGISPTRKFHQVAVTPGSDAERAPWSARLPGWMITPSAMPMLTAISAVIPNYRSVRPASRAAFVTRRRLPMLDTIARNTSGMTAAFSSDTYAPPIVSSVAVSPFGPAPEPEGPICRATTPTAMPSTSAAVTWNPKDRSQCGPR